MLHRRTILHPTDMTAPSENAFHLACSLARDHAAKLIILHVTEPLDPAGIMPRRKPSPQYFKERRRELRREIPPVDDVVTKFVLREGNAEEAILEVARRWDVDLVVMGTHGRTGLKHLFVGSVAEKVVRQASCPVLTVKLPFVEKVEAAALGTNGANRKKRVDAAARVTGGGILAGATVYSNPLPLTTPTRVRARVRNGTEWSALADAMFYPEQDLTRLVVSEILYNPVGAPGVDGDAFEFLELKNIGDTALDLTGLRFDAGIDFAFSPGTRIAPGAFLMLGQNSTNFLARYPGVPLHGVYSGRLDNGGETLRLIDAVSNVVFSFRYDDTTDWPAAADGDGFSLVPRNPAGAMIDAGNPDYWRASTASGGSPGLDDPEPTPPSVGIQAEGSGNGLHYLLIWSGGPMEVEHATSLTGPWLPIEAAGTSPFLVWPTADTGFFRLRQR